MNNKIDQSILYSYLVNLFRNSVLSAEPKSRAHLERFSSSGGLKTAIFLMAYYNSINEQNLISLPREVIGRIDCGIRLINTSKYYKNTQQFSDLSLLSKFIDAQASFSRHIQGLFQRSFSKQVALLASGTLIGAQSYVPIELKDQLISTGLIHVIVASGYNLTLVTSYVQNFLSLFFSKRTASFFSLAVVWWYVVLVGMNPSILRAGWMASLLILSTLVGRPHAQLRGVLLGSLVMLAIQPDLLISISFQLSVSATVGVILINMKDSEISRSHTLLKQGMVEQKENKPWWQKVLSMFKENAVTTFGANLLTLPIILFWFGRVSVIAIVANTALLWIIPLLMMSAFCFLVTIHLHYIAAFIFIISTSVLANLFLWGVVLFAKFPFATIDNIEFSLIHTVTFYCCLFIFFKFFYLKKTTSTIK